MKCKNCESEMKKVNMSTDMGGRPYLWYKKKGFMELEKRSTISCYVCTECGDIKLNADTPEVFKNI